MDASHNMRAKRDPQHQTFETPYKARKFVPGRRQKKSKKVNGVPQLTPTAECLAIAQLNQQNSPLLNAPAEIRNRIYEFALDMDSDSIFHPSFVRDSYFCSCFGYDRDYHDQNDSCQYYYEHESLQWNRLEFSRTCRQIFAETAANYFKTKLLPLATHVIGFRKEDAVPPAIIDKLTVHQKALVRRLFLFGDQAEQITECVFMELPSLKKIIVPEQGRLSLPYGDRYGLEILAEMEGATVVEVRKPKDLLYLD